MFFTILALVGEGDEVIYPNPGFPIYESVINFVGGVPVPIPLLEARGFGFDLELFERRVSSRTRLIIVNSPANPTGGVLDRGQLERIAAIAVARGIPVLADEIYRRFLYEGEFVSITGFPGMRERTILLDGFSKSYAMTGWRLGNEAGVAVLAGAAFGAHGEGYLRLSYANSEANLRLALDRMRPVFESLAKA